MASTPMKASGLTDLLSKRREQGHLTTQDIFGEGGDMGAEAAFRHVDKDGSGSLERSELERAFKRLGSHMTAEQMDDAMASMDADGSGLVSMEEFIKYWTQEIAVADDADDEANWAQLTVPDGMNEGEVMSVDLDDGRTLEVEVPEGLTAGDEFEAFIGHEELDVEEEPEAAKSDKPELPEGWTEKTSKTSGETYYYNTATGEATWEVPVAKPPPTPGASNEAAEEKMPESKGESDAQIVSVVCPDGVVPGDFIMIEHDGHELELAIPEGIGAGDEFEIELELEGEEEQEPAETVEDVLSLAREKFNALDIDSNGVLQTDETKELAVWVFGNFQPRGLKVHFSDEKREQEATKLAKKMDEDGDGLLSFDEFAEWFKTTWADIEAFHAKLEARKTGFNKTTSAASPAKNDEPQSAPPPPPPPAPAPPPPPPSAPEPDKDPAHDALLGEISTKRKLKSSPGPRVNAREEVLRGISSGKQGLKHTEPPPDTGPKLDSRDLMLLEIAKGASTLKPVKKTEEPQEAEEGEPPSLASDIQAWHAATMTFIEQLSNTLGSGDTGVGADLSAAMLQTAQAGGALAVQLVQLASLSGVAATKAAPPKSPAPSADASGSGVAEAELKRGGQLQGTEYEVTLARDAGGFGIDLTTLDVSEGYTRIQVESLAPSCHARAAGVQVGDEVLQIAGVDVSGRGTQGISDAFAEIRTQAARGLKSFVWRFIGAVDLPAHLEQLRQSEQEMTALLRQGHGDASMERSLREVQSEIRACEANVSQSEATMMSGWDLVSDNEAQEAASPRAQRELRQSGSQQPSAAAMATPVLELISMQGGGGVQVLHLEGEHCKPATVGRTLPFFQNDPKIPRQHLKVFRHGDGGWRMQALSSKIACYVMRANGTSLEKVAPGPYDSTPLLSGDVLHLRRGHPAANLLVAIKGPNSDALASAASASLAAEQEAPVVFEPPPAYSVPVAAAARKQPPRARTPPRRQPAGGGGGGGGGGGAASASPEALALQKLLNELIGGQSGKGKKAGGKTKKARMARAAMLREALVLSCKTATIDVIPHLCALGAKVDEPDEKGCTPLYIACTMGHAHVVLALGRLGADPNQPSNRGVTPLEACEMYGHDRAADAVRSLMAVAR